MAGIRFISFVFLLSCIYFVKSDECVTYGFESGYDSLFGNDAALCSGMTKWIVGNYSEIGVESFNPNSDSFVSPSSTLSCTSSFEFSMSAGGVVEVNVYTNSTSITNHLTLLALQSVPGGNDAVIGALTIVCTSIGWNKYRTTVLGTSSQKGYIIIMGVASEDSLVLVDSFRYIPPGMDESACVIYGDEKEDITTEIPYTTTERNEETEDCVTINFEEDFEVHFTTDNYLCSGFVPWHLDNYTSINIESPNPDSTMFMAPNEFPSCIASFIFEMAPNGTIEVKVFMDQVSAVDHIIVVAQKKTDKDYDTVAGFKMYYPQNQHFIPGWHVLRFTLLDFKSFDGYLVFIGSAQTGSIVLIDSVRYIPPLTSSDDASCDLY